ncbi:hypothetical protein C7H52_04760 [Aurantibacter aestuarii]|uniref:Methyltransferase domain-containing protein n=2 Tax=Aurantibacter aestuarii TaxID=1266046 RepID=A0A2T1NDS9_9FLAO|nr:hypothetical protein C7H52_04760 [Aurantibacter aestuarii]
MLQCVITNLMDYLKYIAKTGRTHQHPYGQKGTYLLLEKLPKNLTNKTILEVGCGTGHTAAILSKYDNLFYTGVDTSLDMINFSNKRKEKLNLTNCNFKHTTIYNAHFKNNYFDVIICESVLAIQDFDSFHRILKECFRILKHEGVFIFNETLWNERTKKETIKKTNSLASKHFGIIQAEPSATLNKWIYALKKNGFNHINTNQITKNNCDNTSIKIDTLEARSLNYSKKSKYLKSLNLRYLFLYFYFKFKNKAIKINSGELETYIFTAKKQKQSKNNG